jgi:hypothetical protein
MGSFVLLPSRKSSKGYAAQFIRRVLGACFYSRKLAPPQTK